MKSNTLHVSRNYVVDIFGGSSSAYYKFFFNNIFHGVTKVPKCKRIKLGTFKQVSYDVIHEFI